MKKKQKEEPPCCFNCRSFSPRNGRKGFGYCMKHGGNRKPKDVCDDHRPEMQGWYV